MPAPGSLALSGTSDTGRRGDIRFLDAPTSSAVKKLYVTTESISTNRRVLIGTLQLVTDTEQTRKAELTWEKMTFQPELHRARSCQPGLVITTACVCSSPCTVQSLAPTFTAAVTAPSGVGAPLCHVSPALQGNLPHWDESSVDRLRRKRSCGRYPEASEKIIREKKPKVTGGQLYP